MPAIVAWRVLSSRAKVTVRNVNRAARQAELDESERAELHHILGLEARRRGTLRALMRAFRAGTPDVDVRSALAVAFIRLFFLEPAADPRAAFEASYELGERKSRFVTSIMRRALAVRANGPSGDPRRDVPFTDVHFTVPVFHDPSAHPLLWAEDALSMPVPLVKRWIRRYGEERAFDLARAALTKPDLSLYVVRGDVDLVRAECAGSVDVRASRHPRVVLAPAAAANALARSKSFHDGTLAIAGEHAVRSAELVEAHPNERVLELCASTGATTVILAGANAETIACARSTKRAERVKRTLARTLPGANVDVRVQDGAVGFEPARFDAALIDAPCSDTGVLAARPAARWRFTTESQRALGELQMRLLDGAAPCIRPSGRLVYATRSIEPEENQRRVRAFLAAHPEYTLEAEIESWPDPHGEHGPVDGGYAARLRRR